MKKIKYIIALTLSFGLVGCHFEILNPKGLIAAAEKNLLVDATALMLIVVLPVIALSLLITWRYHDKNKKSKYAPHWSDSLLLESIWWAIPCIIIAILGTMTWINTHRLDPYHPLNIPQKPLLIQAVALNWKWLFIYPKQQIASVNYLQIPFEVPIRFYVTADAPMNSLEIPQLAGQIYAMAGMRTQLNLITHQKGCYKGLSTNFSGNGFSGMHFTVKATSVAQFKSWVHSVQNRSPALTEVKYRSLRKPSQNNPPQFYSSPKRHLFKWIMIQYTKNFNTKNLKRAAK